MSADGIAPEMCAAYGCPMLGSFGAGSGKWVCCCHFRGHASTNDAITLALGKHPDLVKRAISLRRTQAGHAEILAAENELLELCHEAGQQQTIPTGNVTGPTHGVPPYSETDA